MLADALDSTSGASQNRRGQPWGAFGGQADDLVVACPEERLEILTRSVGDAQAEILGQFRGEYHEIQMLRLGAAREGESNGHLAGLIVPFDAEYREALLADVEAQVARRLGDVLGPARIPDRSSSG